MARFVLLCHCFASQYNRHGKKKSQSLYTHRDQNQRQVDQGPKAKASIRLTIIQLDHNVRGTDIDVRLLVLIESNRDYLEISISASRLQCCNESESGSGIYTHLGILSILKALWR